MDDHKLLKAAVNASNTIHAFYQWIDMVEEAGGTGTISGVAKCHAMIESLKRNKARLDKSIMAPLEEALAEAQETPS